ncbi:hypothetical protein F5141DRAFT_1223413 [Pisolithus sp. B1]|nr:hypothetical protein F5141DRAFT_1223413 [Pisolithus sp. B1]
MSPLRPGLQCSARLQCRSKTIMGSTMGPSRGGREPPQYFFIPQPSSQISAKSKMNYMKKHTQEVVETSGNEAVHWEPYPQLMCDLLTWILQHLADCAILFNEMMDEEIQGKPHSRCKKDINTVIVETIFRHDRQYGESYAAHPARFVTAVASHLIILKNKYCQHASKFKSTGEGISPDDPNHWNLHEKVLAEVFNVTPGTNQTIDFLSIIKHGGTMSVPASGSSQVQDQDDMIVEDFHYPHPHLDDGPTSVPASSSSQVQVAECGSFGDELEQEDEEEERTDEGQGWGWAMSEFPTNLMLVDEPPWIFDDHPTNSTNTFIPLDRPVSLAKCWTPSWDSHSAFWKAPYPKSPLSIVSTSTSTTSSSGLQHLPKTSETSQTKLTKGKSTLTKIKGDLQGWLSELNESSQEQCNNITTLKYEHKSMKMQAYMHNKEIAHLEGENEKDHIEAAKIHN